MFQRLVPQQTLNSIHYLGTLLLVIGMPSSKVLMSLGTMVLALAFVLGFNFKSSISDFRSNKLLFPLLAFILIHLISLCWTSDFNYAAADLRIKVPLLLLPIFYTVKPIPKGTIRTLFLSIFALTVVAISLYNFLAYNGIIGNYSYIDFREMSLFGSHIRFSLMVAFAAGICLTSYKNSRWQLIAIILFSWLSYYTYYSQVVSGFIAWIIVIGVVGFSAIYKRSKKIAWIGGIGIFSSIVTVLCFVMFHSTSESISANNKQQYPKFTKKGNLYFHDTLSEKNNEGKPIMVFICEKELKKAWRNISSIPYEGKDLKKQWLSNTLIRYLDSKHLTKDASGIQALSASDVQAIEKGIADVADLKTGLIARINGLNYQLMNPSNPNGHSLLQRIEYWKTALQIIRKNWLLGVGVGDVQLAFNQQYKQNNTQLTQEHQLRAHNSFLTSWVSFGVFGFVIFCWMQGYFLYSFNVKKAIVPLLFGLITLSSFFLEDTLETQMGVTFFAFFYSFFFEKSEKTISPLS
jgi:hypothetical protein